MNAEAAHGRRERIIAALEERAPSLVDLYKAGVALLEWNDVPAHAALVAHEFRELMDKLPRILDLPTVRPPQVRERLRDLEDRFGRAAKASSCHSDGVWAGKIDDSLRQFLEELRAWFEQPDIDLRTRRNAARDLIRATDPSGAPMPQVIEDRELARWNAIEQYLIDTAHHRIRPPLEEVLGYVDDLEDFLASRMRPPAAEEYAEIDQLIAEAEREGEGGS